MSTVTVQGWGPRQNALCPKVALACPRSAHSKRPLWGDSHSPPSFMTVMSFISVPSAMGQGALSTRPTGERGPRPSSTFTSALHCRPGRRGTSAGRATKKAGVKLVRLESEACPPSGQAAWHVCPQEEEEGVALGPSREGSSPGGTGEQKWAAAARVRGLRPRGVCWARTSGADSPPHFTSHQHMCLSLLQSSNPGPLRVTKDAATALGHGAQPPPAPRILRCLLSTCCA